MSLAVGVSIVGSVVVIGPSLGLGHSLPLPVEGACATSGMGFRAPESLKGSFVGMSITGPPVVMGSSLGLGYPPSLPVEEARASSRMGFKAPKSLKGSA